MASGLQSSADPCRGDWERETCQEVILIALLSLEFLTLKTDGEVRRESLRISFQGRHPAGLVAYSRTPAFREAEAGGSQLSQPATLYLKYLKRCWGYSPVQRA